MGLIDALAGQTLEVARDASNKKSSRREAFRGELIEQLREYSLHIESVRIVFNWIYDCLRERRTARLDLPKWLESLAEDDCSAGAQFNERAGRSLSELEIASPPRTSEFELALRERF